MRTMTASAKPTQYNGPCFLVGEGAGVCHAAGGGGGVGSCGTGSEDGDVASTWAPHFAQNADPGCNGDPHFEQKVVAIRWSEGRGGFSYSVG
jgi:hypothetical protein